MNDEKGMKVDTVHVDSSVMMVLVDSSVMMVLGTCKSLYEAVGRLRVVYGVHMRVNTLSRRQNQLYERKNIRNKLPLGKPTDDKGVLGLAGDIERVAQIGESGVVKLPGATQKEAESIASVADTLVELGLEAEERAGIVNVRRLARVTRTLLRVYGREKVLQMIVILDALTD